MDSSEYAITVPAGAPTVPPPDFAPILVPGSLVPVRLAHPWRRVVAWVIDVVPFILLGLGLLALVRGRSTLGTFTHAMWSKNLDTKDLGLPSLSPTQPLEPSQLASLLEVLGVLLLVFGLWVAYRIVAVAMTGRTAGKWLLGIAVVDAADPRRNPSYAQAFKRWGTPQAVGLIPVPLTGMGPYLWILKDARNQGLHDRAAGTLVVSRPR